ncbi:variant erythrocyte surface antigen-1 alpha subunit [Babesia bovis T2Bo]|uniref:Variant erythrocyte surface antigen-1, alpha subunit n=1 Tax=Babesia bovis TaxID=5865 RepID=A7ATV6_BABBO|nr:variant erythrocyte surface antigen-1 alpha subunit [Babesia bovis T2Bo]EDO06367.1 variant erythrocyte surface antigen-1 alpha subunit [Babesia bovis T2Bo]|eukprot:XP_001609935.1 variant erythrocyte surface antigen-1, alpha subunit [Babesia bovis T2Bo]
MAVNSTFTPKASLTEAPTNLKEAIDWVLRVTGRDGKALEKDKGECICGLAAAVTDLLQSVELEYNGYQGEPKDKGATQDDVTKHLNGLFSLVQGLGGTAVVRTYIDQLAQVLSALVGWSKIEKCGNGSNGKCQKDNKKHHGLDGCAYLNDIKPENKCETCGCMKWDVSDADREEKGHHLGRRCTRCSDSGGKRHTCSCGPGDGTCQGPDSCKCALAGKCCKCCCKGKGCGCSDKCSCYKEDGSYCRIYHDSYQSAYTASNDPYIEKHYMTTTWNALDRYTGTFRDISTTSSQRRHQCAQILLGSVCLIWSGVTYMHWTGKYAKGSPYWNNHILDGSGLDDGTLSQWLQALGFPRDMLNNAAPKNRLDKVIWDGLRDKFFLGFLEPSGLNDGGKVNDINGNTARSPFGMNYAGFVHTAHRDSFNNEATVFTNGSGSSITETNQHKNGAIFKLYILSCAYFTGLQKKAIPTTTKTPKTIREILYWLSALPYSQAYKEMLTYAKNKLKDVTKKPGDTESSSAKETQLKFHQTGLTHPFTVDEYNLFAHFQAVTQYCPLVLIGIQGGIHSTKDTKDPAIHSLYSNTECKFTYPAVPIQAYNQVVHYIRALFYQLYFLRKQCAVKVALGGKWRECRYGSGVLGNGVISWMCLGCDPMEHDRKCRVKEMGKGLDGVVKKLENVKVTEGIKADGIEKAKALLVAIGNVVVQLGNAQEALEGKKTDEINKVKTKLTEAKGKLDGAKGGLDRVNGNGLDEEKLKEAKAKLVELTNGSGRNGILGEVCNKLGGDVDPAKNEVSKAINGVLEAVKLLKEWAQQEGTDVKCHLKDPYNDFLNAIDQLISICNSPKCSACDQHSAKCGKPPVPRQCPTCHQQYMDGFPSALQAFLEDRLPGFSCQKVLNDEKENPNYPPAASHLGHCNGSGQCCPLPMGFRGQFHKGGTSDMTGSRLYGILYFFSNENMMQSCVYTLVRVTAALSATTPQVLGDVFGFFRGGIGEKESGKTKNGETNKACEHNKDPSKKGDEDYFCGWCASGLRDEVKKIEWIPKGGDSDKGGKYRGSVGQALIQIKGDKDSAQQPPPQSNNTSLSRLTQNCQYLSPLTGELYTAVSATFGGTYLSWVLYLSDALHSGLESLSDAFKQIECRGCKGQCDPNKCRKGEHGQGSGQCGCQSIVSCTGVLPVLYRHGFSYGNPFNLEGYEQKGEEKGDYSIENTKTTKRCHEFLDSLSAVIQNKQDQDQHPLTELLTQVGQLQYDIRLPWIFVLAVAWLVAVLYLAFGAILPLDWTHMRSHWLRGGEHQWQCMWYKVMTGRKGMELVEYFERR